MVPFATFWGRLKDEFATCPTIEGSARGKRVRKWSAVRGDMDGNFIAVWTGGDTVLCNTEKDDSPRTIGRSEFEKVYRVWADYKSGAKGRSFLAHEMGVQNCTWIIPILYRHEHLMQ